MIYKAEITETSAKKCFIFGCLLESQYHRPLKIFQEVYAQ